MQPLSREQTAVRIGFWAAVCTVPGILLSGPVGVLIIALTHPQPAWRDARTAAENFHFVQNLPYFGGIFLLVAYVVTFAAIYQSADESRKPYAFIAAMFSMAYATLISLNYIIQTTFLPAILTRYRPELDQTIAILSMVNPTAIGWAIEMWGYAFLGLATWFAAPAFRRNRLENITAALFIFNGIISVLGALVTSARLDWVLTAPGLVSYLGWNALMLVIAVLTAIAFRRRQQAGADR
jgi:hypothetical protein